MNRWKVVAGSLLIQLSNGGLYAWSVFTPYLTGQTPDGFTQFNFTSTETQVIFSTALAAFALVMIFAGHLQVTIGPRVVSMAGGLILASGYILAGLFGTSFFMQLLTIGLLGG